MSIDLSKNMDANFSTQVIINSQNSILRMEQGTVLKHKRSYSCSDHPVRMENRGKNHKIILLLRISWQTILIKSRDLEILFHKKRGEEAVLTYGWITLLKNVKNLGDFQWLIPTKWKMWQKKRLKKCVVAGTKTINSVCKKPLKMKPIPLHL